MGMHIIVLNEKIMISDTGGVSIFFDTKVVCDQNCWNEVFINFCMCISEGIKWLQQESMKILIVLHSLWSCYSFLIQFIIIYCYSLVSSVRL